MTCEQIEVYLSGYLDKELTQQDEQRVEIHLRTCEPCRKLLEELKEAQEAAHYLELIPPTEEDWMVIHSRIVERMSRRLGWSILVVWLSVTIVFSLFQYATSPQEPFFEKILVFGLFLAFGLLFLSVLTQRLRERRVDRYKGVTK